MVLALLLLFFFISRLPTRRKDIAGRQRSRHLSADLGRWLVAQAQEEGEL